MENSNNENNSGKRIYRGVIILILSAVLILFQFKYFIPLIYNSEVVLWLEDAVQNAGFSILWSFWLGIIFGIIICPFCALPLASYASSAENRGIGVFKASLLFNFGRLILFILIGLTAGFISISIILNSEIISYAYILAGIMMLFLAVDLFGLIEIRKFMTNKSMGIINKGVNKILLKFSSRRLNFKVNHPVEYIVWGLITGVACGIEFLLPMLIVWANAISFGGAAYAVLVFGVFGIATFIPSTLLITFIGGTVNLAQKRISSVQYYARYSGALFLLFLGFVYIFGGITFSGTFISRFTGL